MNMATGLRWDFLVVARPVLGGLVVAASSSTALAATAVVSAAASARAAPAPERSHLVDGSWIRADRGGGLDRADLYVAPILEGLVGVVGIF